MNPASDMFLYLFLVLFPAASLAQCNETEVRVCFDGQDTNMDERVTRTEADIYLNLFDADGDEKVTLDEVKATAQSVDPKLKGLEKKLFDFVDLNTDGRLTSKDVDRLFYLIDANYDGATSWDEYKSYLKKICSPYKRKV
ncbi:hypothetical protein BsWGS_07038 [Bradybaena similaris]